MYNFKFIWMWQMTYWINSSIFIPYARHITFIGFPALWNQLIYCRSLPFWETTHGECGRPYEVPFTDCPSILTSFVGRQLTFLAEQLILSLSKAFDSIFQDTTLFYHSNFCVPRRKRFKHKSSPIPFLISNSHSLMLFSDTTFWARIQRIDGPQQAVMNTVLLQHSPNIFRRNPVVCFYEVDIKWVEILGIPLRFLENLLES